MAPLASAFLAASILAAHSAAQAVNSQIVGTWSTKSKKVLTGSGFYNPAQQSFTEPALTGISYSFTLDGHYEEAYYRAVPNPQNPACPEGLIQWQHGSYVQAADTSMILTPISVDGRMLSSDPCNNKAILLRYTQPESFSLVNFTIDPYNQEPRLDIEGFDGTPMNPMWQVSTTPQMLPTTTLTPAPTNTATTKQWGSSSNNKMKRAADWEAGTIGKKLAAQLAPPTIPSGNRWFWLGVSMTGVGSILVFYC